MTVNLMPVLPIILPLAFTALTLGLRHRAAWQIKASLFGFVCLLLCAGWLLGNVLQAGTQVVYLSNWVPPFGISIVADVLSAILVFTTSIIALCISVYSVQSISPGERQRGFYPLSFAMIAGVNGAFLTGDIFNLYVWYEVMLISSLSLLMLGRTRATLDAGIKYFAINMVKTILLLTAIGMLYGTTGTLNMADLHLAVQNIFAYEDPAALKLIGIMLLLGFGIKAGLFPLYFWLPASYHTPSPAIGALFAALLTKVGIYSMLRVFTLVLPFDQLGLLPLVSIVAIATMLVPLLSCFKEKNIKRLLSFCLLSHIGVMLAGLALYNETGLTGSIFYTIHHMCIMAYLFLIIGAITTMYHTDDMRLMGGLLRLKPWLAWLFFVPLLALSGLPPFSGFWPKLLLVKGAFELQQFALAASILVTGFLTLYVMIRSWHAIAWRNYPIDTLYYDNVPIRSSVVIPLLVFLGITALIGLYPEPLMALASQAARALLDPYYYVDAVIGGVS